MRHLGRPDVRQEGWAVDGRALRVHGEIEGRGGGGTARLVRLATAPISAASSSGVGLPRATLTRGSLSIDAAYGLAAGAR